MFSRRTMLLGLAGTAVATASAPALAAVPGRTLHFFRYHNGERLTARYFSHGHYQDGVLQEINKICRDLREKEETAMDVHLLDYVYAVAEAVDPNAVVEIISAYRTPKTNGWLRSKSTNVAKKSKHMQGRAMDIRIRGHEAAEVAEIARKMKRGGVGLYHTSGFVHLDTGRPRFWEITPEQTLRARAEAARQTQVAARDPAAALPDQPRVFIPRQHVVAAQPRLRPLASGAEPGRAPLIVRARPSLRPL